MYELLPTHSQDCWGFWEAHLPGDPCIHLFFPLWSHEGLKMTLWVFLPPRAWDMGLLNLYSKIYLELHHLLVLISLWGLISACLALFLDYFFPTQCPPPPSLTWILKQIWMGRMKLIVNVILFPLLRPRPCLRRLKDVGSCDLKKIFPLRTIVSVLSSEFWLGKLEGQPWPVLCFYISVLTTCPRATSMQCCSCLD